MKKLFLSMGLACLFMVACNNAPKQEAVEETIDTVAVVEEVVEEHVCPLAQLLMNECDITKEQAAHDAALTIEEWQKAGILQS